MMTWLKRERGGREKGFVLFAMVRDLGVGNQTDECWGGLNRGLTERLGMGMEDRWWWCCWCDYFHVDGEGPLEIREIERGV